VPRLVMIGEFISNSFIPILVCCISGFSLFASESLFNIVLNSFALVFIYFLDDMVNTFEKDSDFLLKEDMNLFVKQMRNAAPNKKAVRSVSNVSLWSMVKSFGKIMWSFVSNFVFFYKFCRLFALNEKEN